MISKPTASITIIAVLLVILLTAFAGTAAADHDLKDPDHDTVVSDTSVDAGDDLRQAYAGTNEAADTPVRKAFLKAKKAFHEGRQEIQAIQKLEESPAEDVPTFFDGEDDEDSTDDEEFQDGSDPELST